MPRLNKPKDPDKKTAEDQLQSVTLAARGNRNAYPGLLEERKIVLAAPDKNLK